MQANEEMLLYAAEYQHLSKEQRQRKAYEEAESNGSKGEVQS